ncbi:hypothetical protein NHH03_15405 [Stieleria sp. TO1_6]|uniref:hypothetical protein n=1 Tax=Stieleria tagensis TaxID=2956795 RepID=UPI00209B4321|nr:hypothetical protein [Stieleria tagensis]MCO8123134.1 hypothetical protein [Stieleria tagensis]
MSHHPCANESLGGVLVRFAIYGILSLALGQVIVWKLNSVGVIALASENGMLEWMQVGLTLCTAGVFARVYFMGKSGATVFGVLACVVAYAGAKECDSFLESFLFDDAYKYVAGGPLALLVFFLVCRGRDEFVSDLSHAIAARWFGIFVTAGILLISLCQLFDSAGLWETFDQSTALREAKLLVEETSELYVYYFLAVAALECWFQSKGNALPAATA